MIYTFSFLIFVMYLNALVRVKYVFKKWSLTRDCVHTCHQQALEPQSFFDLQFDIIVPSLKNRTSHPAFVPCINDCLSKASS